MKRLQDTAFAAVLVLLVIVLYRKVVRLWWTYDDAYLLHLATDYRLADAFFSSAQWPQKLFTPIVMVFYEGEMSLLGLNPTQWFVVHLVFVTLSALAFYGALRLYFQAPAALAGSVLYVASVPLCSLTTEISGIHYFVAILTGSLAAIAYVAALRRGSAALTILSALLYLLGMLAKETIVPLPLFFLVVPDRTIRARIRFTIPHWIALAIYLLWRRAVIGTFLGGYGWATRLEEWPGLIASLPKKIILACAGVDLATGLGLTVLLITGIVCLFRYADSDERRRRAVMFIVALALAVGPILPVSKEMQRRYVLMPWLCVSIAFVAGAESLRRRDARGGMILLALVPLLAVINNRQEWSFEYGRTLRMSEEARFFTEMPAGGLLRHPAVPPAAMGEFNWLKSTHLGKQSGAGWFYDDFYLCTAGITGRPTWQYSAEKRKIVNVSADLPRIARRHCKSIRHDQPLSAEFEYRDGTLFWEFGPYEEGRYRVLMGEGVQAFDVPRADGFLLPDIPGLTLRIRYDAPEGWTTYSPPIALDFVHRPRTVWRR